MSPRSHLLGGGSSSNSSSSGGLLSGLFGSSSSNSTYTGIPDSYFDADPVTGTWSLQKLFAVTAAPLTAITALVCFGIACSHLASYTVPHQQRQIARVVIVPAVFAIFSIIGLCFYRDSNYVVAIADFYEIYALVGFFYYLISVVAPDESTRLEFFQQLEITNKDGTSTPGLQFLYVRSPKYILQRLTHQKQWLAVFQILPGRLLTTIITMIVYGVVCPFSNTQRVILLVINIFNSIQMVICLLALLRTYMRLKPYLVGHGILKKAALFKGIIGIQALQRIIFSALVGRSVFQPTRVVSYMDWAAGVPDFMTVCEMFLVCWLFVAAFGSGMFRPGSDGAVEAAGKAPVPAERRSFVMAWVDCLNPMDMVRGFMFTFRLRALANGRAGGPAPPYGADEQMREH
jgi:hypothetical protein